MTEEAGVVVYFSGGIFNGTEFSTPSLVKGYARKASFGEIFSFDRLFSSSDGVFRTSSRGWYTFSHTTLAFLFWFGHLWHSGRALFRDIWTGVKLRDTNLIEYGLKEKLN